MRTKREHWVIVAGGFHARGGMDRANAALARHLLAKGHTVHMVAHSIAGDLATHTNARTHIVARPANSYLLGEYLLARAGRRVAREVVRTSPGARVVTNGGNCRWPDVNWVHSVHHAWPPSDAGAPVWFKLKNRLTNALSRRRERRAIRAARTIVANSERTRRDTIELLGVRPERVFVVQLGSDAACTEATPDERMRARASVGLGGAQPVVAFVGALGHDQNKGFDTLWRAWTALRARGDWDAALIVAGGGRGVEAWRAEVRAAGLEASVRVVGFAERVEEIYAAADLLVSPVRYEAYGLNVHEAVCRGAAALVSRSAGVAETFPAQLSEMLLPDAEDAADLAARLLAWRADVEGWRRRFAPLASRLRARTWGRMAEEFVAAVGGKQQANAIAQSSMSEAEVSILGARVGRELNADG